jgi:hypothetical protein
MIITIFFIYFSYIKASIDLNKKGMRDKELRRTRLKWNKFVYDIDYENIYKNYEKN